MFDSHEVRFLLGVASRSDLCSTQPSFQWLPGEFSLKAKRPEREADGHCVEVYLHSSTRIHDNDTKHTHNFVTVDQFRSNFWHAGLTAQTLAQNTHNGSYTNDDDDDDI